MDSSPYAAPPAAVRAFVAFRSPQLPVDRFVSGLCSTFMPGTPYMLQPLGLAAYLPARIEEQAGSPCPHEVALITWPSRPIQQHATHDTLRGRVYTQSHGGLYSPETRAVFCDPIDAFDPQRLGAFFLFDANTDWQAGSYTVYVAGKADPNLDAVTFRSRIRDAVRARRADLEARRVDQCIAAVGDAYAVIWSRYDRTLAQPEDPWGTLDGLVGSGTTLLGSRIICRDEPPTVEITGSKAFNFIFVRQPEWFLD